MSKSTHEGTNHRPMSAWPPFVIETMQTLSIPYWEEGGDEPLVTFVGRWGGVDANSVKKAVHQASGEELVLAVILLAKSQGAGAADELTRLQRHPKQRELRWWSALLLSDLGDGRARQTLETMLTEELPSPDAFSDPQVQLQESVSWILQRASAADRLGVLGGPTTLVLLRQALERALELETVVSAEAEAFIIQRLHRYQSALAASLGQLAGLGTLTGLHPAEPAVWIAHNQSIDPGDDKQLRSQTRPGWHLMILCIDLLMGHLRHRFDPKLLYSHGSFSFAGIPELRDELAKELRQVFAWDAEAIKYALEKYEIHQLSDLSFL